MIYHIDFETMCVLMFTLISLNDWLPMDSKKKKKRKEGTKK